MSKEFSVGLDAILQELGPFGRYNVVNYLLLLFPIYLAGMYGSVYVFEAPDISYRYAVNILLLSFNIRNITSQFRCFKSHFHEWEFLLQVVPEKPLTINSALSDSSIRFINIYIKFTSHCWLKSRPQKDVVRMRKTCRMHWSWGEGERRVPCDFPVSLSVACYLVQTLISPC